MTTQIRLFQRFQPKVDRGNAKSCQICATKFNLIVPQHQCKRCLRSICNGCGLTKRDVYKPKMNKKPHRLCKICALQSTILIQYISSNKLKFGEDSQIGKKWQSKLSKSNQKQINIKQQRKFTIQIFIQLWDAYNFSLREFIGLHTYNMGQNDVYKLINTVYMQLHSRGIQQKIQNVILIIIFLLCFSNTQTCTNLVEYLCNLKKVVTDQKQILQTYLKALGVQDTQYKKLTDYINFKCKQFIGSMSINSTTAQCSIFVISKAFQKQRIDQTFMTLAIMMQDNWDELVKNRTNMNQCQYLIIKNCRMGNYNQKYKMLVSVKVSQFIAARVVLKINNQTQQQNPRMVPIIIDETEGISRGTPKFDKKLSLQQSFEITQFDQANSVKKKQSVRLQPQTQIKKLDKVQQSQQSMNTNTQNMDNIFAGFMNAVEKSNKNNVINQSLDKDQINQRQDLRDFKKLQTRKQSQIIQTKQIDETSSMAQKIILTKSQKVQQSINLSKNISIKRDPIVYYQKQHCQECSIKSLKLEQLQEQLQHKRQEFEGVSQQLKVAQNQIQTLKLQLKHLKQIGTRQQREESSNQQMDKLKKQLTQITQRYNNVMKDLFKFQKQNKNLRNQTEELTMNNSILKSKLQQKSLGIGGTSKRSQNQDELIKMNELLKKNIQNKNKQLQTLNKKNKELSSQLEQISKSQVSSNSKQMQKLKSLEKQKQGLMLKMKQLGDLVLKQQEEKLGLSSELFQLRRQSSIIKVTPSLEKQVQPSADDLNKRPSQCLIF